MDRLKSSGGKSQTGEAKRRGAEPSGQMRDEKLHTVVARSTKHTTDRPLSEVAMSNVSLCLERRKGGGVAERVQRLPPKQNDNTYFHRQCYMQNL